MSSRSALGFLLECYRAERARLGITHLGETKIESATYLGGEDNVLRLGLVHGIDSSAGAELYEQQRLYSTQKSIVFGAFIVAGRFGYEDGSEVALCAPLLLYDAEVVFDKTRDTTALSVLSGSGRYNPNVATALTQNETEPLDYEIPERFDASRVHDLAAYLHDLRPELDVLPMTRFPELSARLSKDARNGKPVCHHAQTVLLVRRSRANRGMLTELESLVGGDEELSRPLQVYLGAAKSTQRATERNEHPPIPALLSSSQDVALKNAASRTHSMIVGPPGTGKSFTLAAIALEHAIRGESVLVCTHSPAALDSIAERLISLLPEAIGVLRIGGSEELRELKARLDRWLRGIWSGPSELDPESLRMQQHELVAQLDQSWRLVERDVKTLREWSRFHGRRLSWLDRVRRYWCERKLRRQRLSEDLEHYTVALEQFVAVNRQRLDTTLTQRLAVSLDAHRVELRRFRKALGARTDLRQQELFDKLDLAALLHTFPIWFVVSSRLSDALPFKRELFDVALVDEASQMDMTTMIPIAQRAKRLAVAGDPYQLRHISFLSRDQQHRIANAQGLPPSDLEYLNFRRHSSLDRIENQLDDSGASTFLNEHFRSGANLIHFSNRHFYGEQLRVMKSRPDALLGVVHVHRVDAKRDQHGVNSGELEAICQKIDEVVAEDPSVPTLGVLSPFRAQADALSATLAERLSSETRQRHQLIVGTAHELQGQERDVMCLSFCLDDESHAASFRYLDRPNMFNVAVTRARLIQHVYHSFDPERIGPESLASDYLNSSAKHPGHDQTSPVRDAFIDELRESLIGCGHSVWTMAMLAGVRFDLVVKGDGNLLGVDLLGYPGASEAWVGLDAFRLVHKVGFAATVVSYFDWLSDREAVLKRLNSQLSAKRDEVR
ncbi:MAG: AAA domain-containing protein [Myxococcota bacterium]